MGERPRNPVAAILRWYSAHMNARDHLVWAAGLLEGEGYFWVRSGSKPGSSPSLVVNVCTTDRDVLDRVTSVFPNHGKVHEWTPKGYKTQYSVDWYGQNAEDLMRSVLPMMGKRQAAKIQECLLCPGLSHQNKYHRQAQAAARRPRINGRFAASGTL